MNSKTLFSEKLKLITDYSFYAYIDYHKFIIKCLQCLYYKI